jgi:hypothetical protein
LIIAIISLTDRVEIIERDKSEVPAPRGKPMILASGRRARRLATIPLTDRVEIIERDK